VRRVEWVEGTWLNEPAGVAGVGQDLVVECAEGSDFWRTTYYGFERDSGHALLVPLADETACEVSFVADLTALYDQAGVLVRASASAWVKAGLEVSDGVLQVGAVVTNGASDWSCAPVPSWAGQTVTVRASRAAGSLILRARAGTSPWRTIRLAPFQHEGVVLAGLYCASPQRAGLTVRFSSLAIGRADEGLHLE
jgi:regulation of enolase protein 1 (concanavalin A-like superfamily)